VLHLGWAYGSVKVMADEIFRDRFRGTQPAPEVISVPVESASYGEDGAGLVDGVGVFLASLPADDVPATAVIDHVFSNTGAVCPVAPLIRVLRAAGVRFVIVDGAHGPLQLPLEESDGGGLEALGADVYCANLHKWVSAVPGVGFVYLGTALAREHVRPVVISHGYRGGIHSANSWDGTRDYAGALSVVAALDLIEDLGGAAAVRRSMRSILASAVQSLVEAWGTETLVPMSNYATMATVRLPCRAARSATGTVATEMAVKGAADGAEVESAASSRVYNSADAKAVQDALFGEHAIECPVKCIEGALYVRISAHIYNTPQDYAALARAGLKAVERIQPHGGDY
jgi:isopenicillin-N epimerase